MTIIAAPIASPRPRPRRWWRWLLVALVPVLALLALLAWLLLGSRAQLDGTARLPGLSAPVAVERDALGVTTITAANRLDAMRALGYVHAQERYFEMDLSRRLAAGELSALVGAAAIDSDRKHRVHRLRARVAADIARMTPDDRAMLDAYVTGVNAGLAGLRVRPWPYLLLRQAPQPWTAEDTALTGMAMYFDLQDSTGRNPLALWRMQRLLPAPLYALLTRDGTQWDAPLFGPPRGNATLPPADVLDLRRLPAPGMTTDLPSPPVPGSNNFAVAGNATADGRAIVANDMHLTLRAPNIWFRARLRYADPLAPGGRVDLTGFSLPGMPAIVVGSNGHVAWGFTNSYVDTADWMRLRPCTATPTPGCWPVRIHKETIRVAGGEPVSMTVEDTAWGPILEHEADGHALALRWVAQLPGALNLRLADLSRARSVSDALAMGNRIAIPTQNLMLADRDGHIGWRLLGPLPQRTGGCDAAHRVEDADAVPACRPWGIATDRAPQINNPPAGRLWTANNRTLNGPMLASVGNGGYDLGARAWQIRNDLFARRTFDERGLLAIQLDDRALFLDPWHRFLLAQAARQKTPAMRALARASGDWNGHAATDSVGYRLVRAWRLAVLKRIANGLAAPALAELGPDFTLPSLPQLEGVAWPLVQQQPANLLPRADATWPDLFEAAAQEVRQDLAPLGPLDQRTWGERNTARICHPLAAALPKHVAPVLCMPAQPLPGDADMPRVQAPSFGASERMVVSPGHERDGIIEMPGGQSDHPLSPFWGAGEQAWVQGRATPFLPGPARYRLEFRGH